MFKNRKDKKMTSRISRGNQLLQLTHEDIAFKKQILEKREKDFNELGTELANLNQVKSNIMIRQYSRMLVSLVTYYQTNREFSLKPYLVIKLEISCQTYMLEISYQTYSLLASALRASAIFSIQ